MAHIRHILRRPLSVALLRMTVCAGLMLVLSGGPWLALQTIAWTRMLVVYSQEDGLALGITKTFDGQHPCSLCKSIARATAEERTQDNTKPKIVPLETIWLAVLPDRDLFQPVVVSEGLAAKNVTHAGLVHSPPTPPPRA